MNTQLATDTTPPSGPIPSARFYSPRQRAITTEDLVVLGAIKRSMPRGIEARTLGNRVHNSLIKLELAGLVYWMRETNLWFVPSQ